MKLKFATFLVTALLFNTTSFSQKIYLKNDSLFVENTIHKEVEELDLSRLYLEELPLNISEFEQLRILNLSDNQLTEVKGITTLLKLEELNLDNNKFLAPKDLSGVLDQLPQLKSLSLVNSSLIYIPTAIFNIPSLQRLDIHDNEIEFIGEEINQLKALQELDLANNNIEQIHNQFMSLNRLKILNISNNPILSGELLMIQLSNLKSLRKLQMDYYKLDVSELPMRAGNIKTLELNDYQTAQEGNMISFFTGIDELKVKGRFNEIEAEQLFDQLEGKKIKKLSIENEDLKQMPKSIGKLGGLKELNLNCNSLEGFSATIGRLQSLESLSIQSEQLNIGSTINQLIPLKQLKRLSLAGMEMISLPNSIGSLRELEELKLSAIELNELPKNMKGLKSLELFQIDSKEANIANLDYLREEMKKCKFVINSKHLNTNDNPLDPPLENVDVEFSNFMASGKESSTITTASGSQISIPENAFLNADNKLVKGNVNIVYREFNDPIDMAFAGIPMTESVEQQPYIYSSAGMFEFRVFQQDEELFPNPENPITIAYNSMFEGDDYKTYYLNPEDSKWDEIGKDSIVSSTENNITVEDPIAQIPQLPAKPEAPKMPYTKDYINVRFLYNKKSKKYHVRFCVNNRKWGRRDTNNKVFSELKHLNRSKWVLDYDRKIKWEKEELQAFTNELEWYNDYDRLLKRRMGDKIRWGSMNLVDDVWIEPNSEGDNFNLVISKSGALKKMEVVPSKIPKRVETAQRKTRLIFSRYKRDLEKRRGDWAKVEKKFKGAKEEYQKALESYQQEVKDYRLALRNYRVQNTRGHSVYRMRKGNPTLRFASIVSFGLTNYDIVQPINNTKPLLANLINEEGQPLNYKRLYVLDFDLNSLLEFGKRQKKIFDPDHTNSIIAILGGDKVAILKSDEFNPEVLKKRNKEVILKEYDMKGRSIRQLRSEVALF